MMPPLLFALLLSAATSLAASETCTPTDGRVCPAPPNTETGPLLLQIKVPDRLDDPNVLSVETTLTNTGDTRIRILDDPNSPLNPTKTHSFDFYKVGKVGERPSNESCPDAAPIDGVMWYEYDPYDMATQSDRDAYMVLEPKQSKTSVSNLSEMYMFPESGSYVVRVTSSARYYAFVSNDGSVEFTQAQVADDPEALKAATVTVGKQAIDPKPNAAQIKTGNDPLADWVPQPEFRQCTAAQQRVVKTAIKAANQTLEQVDNMLAAPDSFLSPRFTDWFGQPSEADWLFVRANYLTIERKPANYRYDCSCNRCDTAAFASFSKYTKTRTINVCKSFWWAPWTGEDSKAGVLIREASRFEFFTNRQDDAPKTASANKDATTSSAPTDYDPFVYQYFAEEAEISPESWGVRSLTSCFSKLCSIGNQGRRRRRRKPHYVKVGPQPVRFRVGVHTPSTLVPDPSPAERRPVAAPPQKPGPKGRPAPGPPGFRVAVHTPHNFAQGAGPAKKPPPVGPSQDPGPSGGPRRGNVDEVFRTDPKKGDRTGKPSKDDRGKRVHFADELPKKNVRDRGKGIKIEESYRERSDSSDSSDGTFFSADDWRL